MRLLTFLQLCPDIRFGLLVDHTHIQRKRKMLHVISINGRHCLSWSGRGITPFHALKPWPLQCAKGAHGYGLPRVPNAIGAIDRTNAGLQRKGRAWEMERVRRRRWRESELQECVPGEPVFGWGRAEGMLPRRAAWRLGQAWKNAPLESSEWRLAGAGPEECSPRAPLNSGALRGERQLPVLLSGSRMAADRVSVWGSASCRQGFRLPWGGERRLKALRVHRPFQKHFTNALS